MADKNYKLYYFDARIRGELARMILGYAGIPFEDIRFTFAQWPEAKAKYGFPGNQVPCMEMNGNKFGQSMAIARYLARETGIAGKNSFEQFKADAVVCYVMDLYDKVIDLQFHCNTEQQKTDLWELISKTLAPRVFEQLDKSLEGQFFLGENPTWADFAFIDACDDFDLVKVTQFMEKYPRLVELRKRVQSLPKMAEYLNKRPKTEY